MILLALLLSTAACDRETDALPTGTTVRDSAGVRITTFEIGLGELPEPIRAEEPALVIGSLEGEGPDVFGSVGSVRIDDRGRLFVADTQARQIVVFGPAGEFVRTLGGQGEGPGEFALLTLLGVRGDSVWGWDGRNRRISVFTVSEGFAAAVTLRTDERPSTLLRSGSRWVSVATDNLENRLATTSGLTLRRDTVVLRTFGPEGEPGEVLARVPAAEAGIEIEPVSSDISRVVSLSTPFMRNAYFVDVGERVMGGANDTFELTTWPGDSGPVHAVWRYPGLDGSVSQADVDAHRDRLRRSHADDPDGLRAALAQFEAMPLPASKPAFTGLRHDLAGRLWVRVPTTAASERWIVLDDDTGEIERVVEFAEDFRLTDVRNDVAVGTRRDDLGVSYAVVFELGEIG